MGRSESKGPESQAESDFRIVQTPGFVAITYELIHDTRVIPIDSSLSSARPMSEAGLAVLVLVAFLLPVPALVWLDRVPSGSAGR